jgi:hypothetical protein
MGPEPRLLTTQDIDRIAPRTTITGRIFAARVMEEMLMDMLLFTFNRRRICNRLNGTDGTYFTIPFLGAEYPGLTQTAVIGLAEIFRVRVARLGYESTLHIPGQDQYFIQVLKRMTDDA